MIDLVHMESEVAITKSLQEAGINIVSVGQINRQKFKIIPRADNFI